ncbi:hypothetical protein IMSHALPRED_008535 [Imshaugia aleurites]|uniref:Uncharacterized protein n=1 Tax=Imshaugia aleurites TaxID=172621 RepID=A0A8H3EQX4_9LECA|nr:hypothetical protein IMSHALPRED_008535 [Imshaugia aleurites]
MEPVSALFAAVNLLAVTDNLYDGVHLMPRVVQDPKIDRYFVRLITEKARFAEWKRRMGMEKDEDVETLISKLPEDAKMSLPTILAPMQKYVGVAEGLFVKYGITSRDTVESHRSFKERLWRVDLLTMGQQQLNEILDSLENCNDGLLTIAPPAGYYFSLTGNDQVLERSDGTECLGLDILERPQPPQSTSQSFSPPTNDRLAETAPENIGTSALNPPVQERSGKAFHSTIELLHSTCHRVLRSIVVQYPAHKEKFEGTGDRLAIWGTGLFRGKVSIDRALNQKSKGISMLRNNISGILADIAVILRERFPVRFQLPEGVHILQSTIH